MMRGWPGMARIHNHVSIQTHAITSQLTCIEPDGKQHHISMDRKQGRL